MLIKVTIINVLEARVTGIEVCVNVSIKISIAGSIDANLGNRGISVAV